MLSFLMVWLDIEQQKDTAGKKYSQKLLNIALLFVPV
jgi:hypothetical protein